MIYESFAKFMGQICCFTSYVSNVQGFPKPLSKEEELIWIEKLEQGDKEARDVLINHNLRLVAHIAKKYTNSLEADDLISVGSIGLIKAVENYDSKKGVLLSTYASRCIENEILMLIRSNKKHKDTISINTLLAPKNDSDELELGDLIPAEDEDEIFQQVETGVLMKEVLKTMDDNFTKIEKEIIKHRYGICGYREKTQKEVAEILGISRSYVSRIENRLIKELQEKFQYNEEKE